MKVIYSQCLILFYSLIVANVCLPCNPLLSFLPNSTQRSYFEPYRLLSGNLWKPLHLLERPWFVFGKSYFVRSKHQLWFVSRVYFSSHHIEDSPLWLSPTKFLNSLNLINIISMAYNVFFITQIDLLAQHFTLPTAQKLEASHNTHQFFHNF